VADAVQRYLEDRSLTILLDYGAERARATGIEESDSEFDETIQDAAAKLRALGDLEVYVEYQIGIGTGLGAKDPPFSELKRSQLCFLNGARRVKYVHPTRNP